MNTQTFTAGTRCFLDFCFGGKPNAICLSVLERGDGKTGGGRIRVRLTETDGAYRKGEEMTVSAAVAVPCVMERRLRKGEYFRRISTLYTWEPA